MVSVFLSLLPLVAQFGLGMRYAVLGLHRAALRCAMLSC